MCVCAGGRARRCICTSRTWRRRRSVTPSRPGQPGLEVLRLKMLLMSDEASSTPHAESDAASTSLGHAPQGGDRAAGGWGLDVNLSAVTLLLMDPSFPSPADRRMGR